jgi:ATP-dependent 26S proteasome regulatory subunit
MPDFIPSRFSMEVCRHLLLNYAEMPGQPLILGIFGAPGEGKTYQLRSILHQQGVKDCSVNAADLESDRAGQPGKMVVSRYVEAARSIQAEIPAALIIDDIDTTVGEWTQNTGTVNHQQVLAQIMHLADRPNIIENIGTVRRVPIFVTGNDPGKIYPPLRRPGRMSIMHWQPTQAEKTTLVQSIFNGILPAEDATALLVQYQHQPVAFFASLRIATVRRAAGSVIIKSSADMVSVTRQPDKYRMFINAALSSSDTGLLAAVREEANFLDQATESAKHSYL